MYCKPFTNPQTCYKTATPGFFLWGEEHAHSHAHSRTRANHGRQERREKKGGGGQRRGRLETGKCAPGQERAFSGLFSRPCQRSPRHPRVTGGNFLSRGSFKRRLCHIHCCCLTPHGREFPARLPAPPTTAGERWSPRGSVCRRGSPAGRLLPGKTRGFCWERGPRSVHAATLVLRARGQRFGHLAEAVPPSPPRCTGKR